MSTTLTAQWQAASARFAALQRREKLLVAGATVFALLFGGYRLAIEPAQQEAARLKKTLTQQQAEQEQLRAQLLALASNRSDPDAVNRAELQRLQQQLADVEREIERFDRLLVAPTEAPVLLQTLLARHRGLSLVSLTTLPPEPLIAPPKSEKGESAKPAERNLAGNLYQHGIEIKIAGSYPELLAYVSELERLPQKLLWGGMRLVVTEHPVSELTITVYTLSLESAWLVV
ncbi:MAG: type II secretion system protein GspM [Rhodocyclaceae bacterium]|nr:type II secretion system protein GspM [Rhodocyclaceae bacterium]